MSTNKQTVNTNNKIITKTPWFNNECMKAREKSFEKLNIFRRTNCIVDKTHYLQAKNNYRSTCEKRKREYHRDLENKLSIMYSAKD